MVYAEYNGEPCLECNGATPYPNGQLSRTYNLEYGDYSPNIILTDHQLVNNRCHDFCQQARFNIETVAEFISSRFGPLDKYEAIINVASIESYYCPPAWYTKRALFGQRKINGIKRSHGTDITVVAHEFCHGLIEPLESPRKNPLEESFCDIFAVLVRNYDRDNGSYWNNPHNWLWDVGENFREGTGSLRRLDTLLSLRFTDAGSVYGQIDWNTAKNYHELSLIHSHAFYRLMTIHNTVIDGQPLFNGEFALNLFGGVLGNISATTGRFPESFSKSRRAFEEKAQVLLRASPHTNHQLDAISQAFIDVGIE